jgi:hypothetical protein
LGAQSPHQINSFNPLKTSRSLKTWFPKVRSGGVVLFHDICVRSDEDRKDFGVWKLWQELVGQFRMFEFRHGYGLGILIKGENEEAINWLTRATDMPLSAYYARRGVDLATIAEGRRSRDQKEALASERETLASEKETLSFELGQLQHTVAVERKALEHNLETLRSQLVRSEEGTRFLEREIDRLKIACSEAQRECQSMRSSLSWKVTWPFRLLRDSSVALLMSNRSKRSTSRLP